MNIALIGYGKMGHEVEKIVLQEHHEIVAVLDNEHDWDTKYVALRSADVAIDFSTPNAALQNIRFALEHKIPLVVGTTGWYDNLDSVLAWAKRYNGSIVYGSNFSIGANLFMQLNELLATWMNTQPQYTPKLEETHHLTKKDAPSGTAIHLAQDIVNHLDRISKWQLTDTEVPNTVLPVKANRIGTVPGIHKVLWHSEEDDLELIHTAYNRQGFARGAVKAALWLTQHPGVYEFQNIALHLNS